MTERAAPPPAPFWVFGYGSLMWRPGFEYVTQRAAALEGYSRSFCMYSHHHRGTRQVPGLVLGLDPGGICTGSAFLVAEPQVPSTIAYLKEREMDHYPYVPLYAPITLDTGERVTAYTFIVNTQHPQYATGLTVPEKADIIMRAEGISGLNRDYLINTVQHLENLGYVEDELHALLKEVKYLTGLIEAGAGI